MPDQDTAAGNPAPQSPPTPPTPAGAPVPHQPSTDSPQSAEARAEREATPMVPHPQHPHDVSGAFGTQVAEDAQNAFKLGTALRRMERARANLEGIAEGFDDEAAAAALTEYLAARDGMSDAMRPFGPPR